MTTTPLATWAGVTAARDLRTLPQSRFVPVDAWLIDPRRPSEVLNLLARGTRVRLRVYDRSDLTTLLLRAECDCEEHRLAGAVGRPVLNPGAAPRAEATYDGAARAGWSGVAAGLLRPDEVAPVLDELLRALEDVDGADAAVAHSA
jgi:hypothetical protein